MLRCLLWTAGVLLGLAPAGVGVGVWLISGVGLGVCVGSACYGALAVWVLRADLLPDPAPREAVR